NCGYLQIINMPLRIFNCLKVMLVTLLISFAVTGELKAVIFVTKLALAQTQTAENQIRQIGC
ncbi:MAG: hypothetical protein ACKO9G_08010, partial [Dolichospermum sp.]